MTNPEGVILKPTTSEIRVGYVTFAVTNADADAFVSAVRDGSDWVRVGLHRVCVPASIVIGPEVEGEFATTYFDYTAAGQPIVNAIQ